ncbi:MAG: segregation/condensation protein A [Pelagibacteraceae bacterium]
MFKVQLQNFEGPIDLLLYFIKRDKIDIYDIPITKITDEYLQVIQEAKNLDISIAGEFLFMASLLLRIKTQMLLPIRKMDEIDIEDPRFSLVEQIVQYKNFKNIARDLEVIHLKNRNIFQRISTGNEMIRTKSTDDYLQGISLYDLSKIFHSLIKTLPQKDILKISRETVSIDDQKNVIRSFFKKKKIVSLKSLIKTLKSKLEIVVTFLAILDMLRDGVIFCDQKKNFDDIEMRLI